MRTASIVVATFIVIIVCLTLVLRSERLALASLDWAVDTFTDLELELVEPHLELLAGKARARQIHLYHAGVDGPALVSVLDFEASSTVGDLLARNLANTALSASAVMIYTSNRAEERDPSPAGWLKNARWVPNELAIDSVHLISENENVWIFPLKGVLGERTEQAGFLIKAAADYEGEPLLLDLALLGLRGEAQFTGLGISGQIVAPESESLLILDGEVQADANDLRYDLAVDTDYKRIENFLDGFEGAADILDGSLELQGRLTGNLEQYTLSAERVIIDNMPTYGFEAAGEIIQTRGQQADISLVASGTVTSVEQLREVAGIDLSVFGTAQASVKLSGTMAAPFVDEFVVITRNDEGLAINMSGSVSLGEVIEGTAYEENRIAIDISGPDLASIEQWIGKQPYETGPWYGSARLSGTRLGITLDDLIVEFGAPSTVEFKVAGNIADIDLTPPFDLTQVSGIALNINASTDDTAILAKWFNLNIPHYHQASASALISGAGGDLLFTEGVIRASSSDLDARLENVGMRVQGIEEPKFSEFGGQLSLTLSDTSALSQYFERAFISLGPISATSTLKQRNNQFALEDLTANVTGENLNVSIRGDIDHLIGLEGTRITTEFSGVDTRNALATLLKDFHYPRPLGRLSGRFMVTNPAGRWSLSDIILANKGSDAIELSLSGQLDDLTGFTTGDIRSEFAINESAILQAATGLAIEPTRGSLQLNTQPGVLSIETQATLGRSRIVGETRIGHDGTSITSLSARADSPHLSLKDLGLQADTAAEQGYRPAAQLDPIAEGARPRRLLERVPPYPTDLELNIDGISGENIDIDRLEIHTTGEQGRYTLRKLNVDYASGRAEVRGIIDLNPEPIAISLAGEGLTLPLNKLATDLGIDTNVDGVVSFRGGLVARGTEAEQLKQTLDGSLAIALEDAVIEGAAYDVLATSVLEWVYSGAALEKSTHIDCTMAQFNIAGGVASSKNLFIETERMVATGTVSLDLPRERIDATIEPRSKSRRLQIPSSVTLRGSLDKPRVITSPIKATADAYAEALMLIPKLTMRMFGVEKSTRKQTRPCAA